MNQLLKVLGFTFVLILAFATVTYVLPQSRGEAPDDKEVAIGALTPESFAALGEKLYSGKGTCTLCHNSLGRAPDLLTYDAVKVALERMADPRYKGQAKDAEGYFLESMLHPSAYVVKGFGKKGSDDSESPMPAVDQPPLLLSEVEVGALIAFLQKKDGNPVTVPLPKEAPAAPASGSAQAEGPAPAKTAEEAIAKFACTACHAILQSESTVGPNLRDVGKRLKVEQIRTSIADPKAEIAAGFPPVMPDFPTMTVTELELIVRFLATQKGAKS